MLEDDDAVSDWKRQAFKEKIAQNEAVLDKMKANIRALENKRYELLSGLNNTSRIMSLLSPEILSEIFITTCVDDVSTYRVPRQFILGRVCRAWRRIAWSTPRLWNRVCIHFCEKRYNTQKILLKDWIQRSGNCWLELSLGIHYSSKDWEPPADSILKFLMTTCHRWTKLDTAAFPNMAQALDQHRPQFPLLNTLHIKMTSTVDGPFLTNWNFYSATPQLRSLDVSNFIPTPQLGINWDSLVELRVSLSFLYQQSIEVLALMPFLEILDCFLIGYNEHFNTSSVLTPNLGRLLSLFVSGHPKMIVTLLNLISTPNLHKLQINFHPITTAQVIWTSAIVDLVQRSSCQLTELTLSQSNITDEGHILDMLRKLSPSLKGFSLYCPASFTLSNRTVNRFNLALARNQRSRQEYLPNLETFVFQGNISFTLDAMLCMLKSRRRHRGNMSDSEDEDEESSSSSEDETDSGSATSMQNNKPDDGPSSESESNLSINISYLNLSWYQTKNPNKMRDFTNEVTKYGANGVSLYLDWKKPDSDDEESE